MLPWKVLKAAFIFALVGWSGSASAETSLHSKILGNGAGYSGQAQQQGIHPPVYELDRNFRCPNGYVPGYRSLIEFDHWATISGGGEGNGSEAVYHRMDPCSQTSIELPARYFHDSRQYHLFGQGPKEYFGFDITPNEGILYSLKNKWGSLYREAWCNNTQDKEEASSTNSKELLYDVLIESGSSPRRVQARMFLYEPYFDPESVMPKFRLYRVDPFRVERTDSGEVRSYSLKTGEFSLSIRPSPRDWDKYRQAGTLTVTVDGKIRKSELSCWLSP